MSPVRVVSSLILCGAVLLSAGGCSRGAPPAQSSTAAPAANAGAATTVTGPVLETMDASSYTYVRVHGESGDVWAAAPTFPVKVGERVVVPLEMPMANFHSQTLNRDFPIIYFVSSIRREGEPAVAGGAAAMPGMMSSHGGGPPAAGAAPPVTAPMPPPAGGLTIADVWARRASLAGKTVTVHGQVVKFNGGILGRNWFHLQDGTGKAADNTNDVTVTTSEDTMVQVGDMVTVTGTVAIDQDFSAGYAYPVMIENGRVTAPDRRASREGA